MADIATGRLRLVRIDSTYRWSARRKRRYDQVGNLVEHKISKILVAFYERAHESKVKRAEDGRRQRKWAEQKRLRKEKEDRREAHANPRAALNSPPSPAPPVSSAASLPAEHQACARSAQASADFASRPRASSDKRHRSPASGG
jgi:hypothetical protein